MSAAGTTTFAPAFQQLRVVCAGCGAVKREGSPGAPTSHGMCDTCLAKWREEGGLPPAAASLTAEPEPETVRDIARAERLWFPLALLSVVAIAAMPFVLLLLSELTAHSEPVLPPSVLESLREEEGRVLFEASPTVALHFGATPTLRAPLGESDPFHVQLAKHRRNS